MNEPAVSVIIAVRNGQDHLAACLDSVLACGYGSFEVVCVDDGSTDRTAEILRSYGGRVTVITHQASLGPSVARNAAAAAARGRLLAFTDGDCIVDRQWLKELTRCFDQPGCVAAGGRQVVPADDTAFGKDAAGCMQLIRFVTGYLQDGTAITEVDHNPSCNSMYLRDIFLENGGLACGLWPGEDVELDYRLRRKGLKILFNPAAVVAHYRPACLRSFSRAMKRYGWAQGVLVRKYGFFRMIHWVPVAAAVAAAGWAALVCVHPVYATASAAAVAAAAVCFLSILARSFKSGMRYAFFLSCLLAGWHIGFFAGLAAGRRWSRR